MTDLTNQTATQLGAHLETLAHRCEPHRDTLEEMLASIREIARRAQANALVQAEREAAIEAWCAEAVALPAMEPGRKPYEGGCAGYWLTASKINEAVRLMRSAPAGDQDAKLRELRASIAARRDTIWNFSRSPKDLIESTNKHVATVLNSIIEDADHLLSAQAASAIAAAPEAPAWREKLDAAAAEIGDEHSYALSIALSDVDYDLRTVRNFVFALREQVESHASRIEALERAAQEGGQ